LALGLVATFLMALAFSIDSIPFFVISAIVLIFVVIDFFQSRRDESNSKQT
jgi:Flp pilus assembly protein TadB